MNWVIMPYIDNYPMTADALRDVLNQRMLQLQVLAIDNGGRLAGFPLPAEEMDTRLLFWRYQPPLLSLSTVWNTALTMVWQTGGTHALVVNNDVRLPRATYQRLVEVQQRTGAWFVSACNVGEAYRHEQDVKLDDLFTFDVGLRSHLLTSKGGPDFSCFLITQECHRWFQFDEQFSPAYFEDNDYHRRLQLAGFGDKIFSVPVPYLHIGSGTLRNVEHVNAGWNAKFQACREYYIQKWGGPPGEETYKTPFNQRPEGDVPGLLDTRILLTGQGRPGGYFGGPASPENWPWQNGQAV